MDMQPIKDLAKIRYKKPIMGLKDSYIIKSILSFFIWIANTFVGIFEVEIELIVLLIVAIIGDWVSGTIRARRKGIYVRSLGFRQSILKVIEYAIFLFILSGVANVFGDNEMTGWVGQSLTHLKDIDWWGYLYVIMTEFKSIGENISGKKGAISKIIKEIHEKIFGHLDDNKKR